MDEQKDKSEQVDKTKRADKSERRERVEYYPAELRRLMIGQQVMVDVGRQGVLGQIGQTMLADCECVDDRGIWLATPTPTGFVGDGRPFFTLICWPTVRALTFSPTCGLVADRGEGR